LVPADCDIDFGGNAPAAVARSVPIEEHVLDEVRNAVLISGDSAGAIRSDPNANRDRTNVGP